MGIKVYWSFLTLTAILVFCFLDVRASIVVAGNATDGVALLEFKSKITDDPFGVLASWNSSIHYCKWRGITCTPRHQRVTILDLQSLQLGGSISPYIGNLSFLQKLHLQNNKIVGNIPTEIGKFVNLQRLEMWNNQLSGTIPHAIGDLQNLKILYLHGNRFSGNIPISIGNLKMLIQLDLSDNFLQGTVPPSFGQCNNLVAVDLSNNNLSGTLSPQLVGLSSLSIFNVSVNLLSGAVSNNFVSCTSLEQLDMHGNLFEGPIGLSLSPLRGLKVLDLSQNNLSGEIPEFLAGFKFLQNLNLSHNNFESMIPTEGIFKNASATSVFGNNKLCGGIPEFQLPTCVSKKTKQNRSTLPLKLVIAIDCGLLVLTLALSSLFCRLMCMKKRGNPTPSISIDLDFPYVSYEALYSATKGFSSENLIGAGNFASVYKGILFEGAPAVAIKVFNFLHHDASKSFTVECEVMRNIIHRKIIKVVTACSRVDYQGNDFKALVYEFMPNGSLEEWIHPITEEDKRHKAPGNLNSLERLNIAIDVASALEYLHLGCKPPIAHCDIKPSNILLNDEMTACVADFGIARFLEATNEQTSSIGVKGTTGYIAPEYGMGHETSSYGDVYSFGILLLEMFTGLRPSDDMFKDNLNLQNWVQSALPERVEEIVDTLFFKEIEEEETVYKYKKAPSSSTQRSIILECLNSICEIGVACSAELPGERMKINDVELGLRLIKKKLLETPVYEEKQTINMPLSRGKEGYCNDEETPYSAGGLSVVTSDDPETSDAVREESDSSEAKAERHGKKSSCCQCLQENRSSEMDVCIFCDAMYCCNCVVKAMGSMPEGRTCAACVGSRLDVCMPTSSNGIGSSGESNSPNCHDNLPVNNELPDDSNDGTNAGFHDYMNPANSESGESGASSHSVSSEVFSCKEKGFNEEEAPGHGHVRKPSVITFRDPDPSDAVYEESDYSEFESIHEKPKAVRKGKKGSCYRCLKGNRFTKKEFCFVCGARYCSSCVLWAMDSMPEGRICVTCIGFRLDASKRLSLWKCSGILKGLLTETEVKQIMRSEISCKANQLPRERVFVNGEPLSERELVILLSCPNPPKKLNRGTYWYDKVLGFWGEIGHGPCQIISPRLNVGGQIMINASNGNTNVVINNRKITRKELWMLKLAGVQCEGQPHFWVSADGSYRKEGMKNVKGRIWDKSTMKLVCALLSLPTPPDSENPCGNEVNGVNVKLLLLGEHNSGTSTIYKRAVEISKAAGYETSDMDIMYIGGLTSTDGLLFPEQTQENSISDSSNQHDPLLSYQLITVNPRILGENCKWLEMFEDVDMVLFCVSLTDYDEYFEDSKGFCTNKIKYDMLEEKIQEVPLSRCEWFANFNPVISHNHHSTRRRNNNTPLVQYAAHYIAVKFKRWFRFLTGRNLFVSLVTASEPETVDEALKYAKEILKQEEEEPVYTDSDSTE
ncbi:Extra-large guanine nucleotide-binding protein 1 [Citrus sinensis]|uniref:Extra-large guanine nucleotide-binding protein 1 n=1 Tax=Citrus sinensis TaxID=2711 RepID=A0ACB8IFW1_CITSI|nr:Extra-large guanine nucleotide-binding protein 1 [Citrus sinensis]